MDTYLERMMISLSNNSVRTGIAATKLSNVLETMPKEDKSAIIAWFEHAKREQQNKIDNALRSAKHPWK